MELGKRKTKVESYVDSLLESPEKKQKRVEFDQSLRQFYRRKWNVPLKPPTVHGLGFDLTKLYDVVMAFGGWQKVSQMEKWADVAEQFGVNKDDILGGDNAIKIIYMRYLSKYEQNETVGEVDDMMDPEMMRSRNRQQSFLATSECPVYIPRPTHQEAQRSASTEADYSRLNKSLLSGLPNETDFAINVCTLLSHPGPRLLKVASAPHIVSLLLAHIGILDRDDAPMTALYESWVEKEERDYLSFWSNCRVDKDFLAIFLPQALERCNKKMSEEELFTGIGPLFSSTHPLSWRVYQVATIIRNLSFEPINRVALAENWDVIRLCVLGSNSEWTQLSTAALDTLSNLSCDIDLSTTKMLYQSGHAILKTIDAGIKSDDKFKLIRCLETMAGLCSAEENENVMCQFLSPPLLCRIFSYLVVKDIMLCVYTLECIYQVCNPFLPFHSSCSLSISEMGCAACDVLCEVPHSMNMLVALASIEAVSFGPTGLAGMKVVEYHAPGAIPQMPQGIPPPTPNHIPSSFPPHTMTPHGGPFIQQTGPPPHGPYGAIGSGNVPPVSTIPPQPIISTPMKPTPSQTNTNTQPSPARIGESKIEQLSAQWIRSSCTADENSATSRGDLYAAYVDDMRNIHHSLSCSLQQFTTLVKAIYPGVDFRLPEGCTTMLAFGLKLNKPHKLAPGSGSSGSRAHPVMKSILERKENGEGDGMKGTICTAEEERTEECTEDTIIRVDNPSSTLKSVVARKIAEKEEKKEKKRKSDGNSPKINGEKKKDEDERVDEEKMENVEKEEETEDQDKSVANGDKGECVIEDKGELMCEWDGCGRRMETAGGVLHHAMRVHLSEDDVPTVCKWPGCDATQRNKWSLITHLQDHHASEHQLKDALRKRKDGRSPSKPAPYCPEIPRELPQHPGYSKNAAIEAIRRHAFNFIKADFTEEPEGPVTKSIRLTACLILRNIARYSIEGRGLLRRHERLLSWMALSRLESNSALAQLLSELPQHEVEGEEKEGEGSSPSSVLPPLS